MMDEQTRAYVQASFDLANGVHATFELIEKHLYAIAGSLDKIADGPAWGDTDVREFCICGHHLASHETAALRSQGMVVNTTVIACKYRTRGQLCPCKQYERG